MGIVAIVPAKANSTRVPEKNYRPFYGDLSLVDILLAKLTRVLPGERVFLSCEDESKARFAARWGARFVLRDPVLCNNDTPLPDFIRGVCDSVSGDDDVLWCEAIDPLFDLHGPILQEWKHLRSTFDSYTVIYPMRQYLLDNGCRPLGFGFGLWHVPSQRLPVFYRLNFVCAVLTRTAVRRTGYVVGERPTWCHATCPFVDIDTEEDFELAQMIYAHIKEKQRG